MKNLFFCFTFLLLCSLSFGENAAIPTNLRCEHLTNPLGVDTDNPRFTWMLNDSRYGAVQTAYCIVVGTDSTKVVAGNGEMWNSKRVDNDQMLVRYEGKELQPYTKYFWRVSSWDKDGVETISKVASFETGLKDMANWQGAWISDSHDINIKPAPYFRKEFESSKQIKSAKAYIAVAGLYELYINGEKIGNHRLDPMYTRFDRRTLYVTHDVSSQLKSGKNAVGVLLGNGWYNHQSIAVWDFHNAAWRSRPTFCLDLRITYTDGSVETVRSDRDWKTTFSPVIFNSIYTAEHYDARREIEGWNKPDFDDSKWENSIVRSAPSQNIVSQLMQPIRDVETILTKTMTKMNDTTYVFDLGRNIAGVSEISVTGEEGTVIRLKHGERLKKDGFVDMSNIDVHYRPVDDTDPFQTDIFILGGKGEESFRALFNYKGFQYVEVTTSKPIELKKESLKGYFMHSDVPPAGTFKSSNQTLDKIWFATNNAYLSNLFGFPTDCPQREKNGWTGDAHIAIETGLFSYDGITVYEKWLADHRDEQQPNGVLPSIIPTSNWGYAWANGPDWTSTIALIPWNIYVFYGDISLLTECYDNIKRYVNYIDRNYPSGLTGWGLGDWVPVKSVSPVELIASAYYYADVVILAKAAELLGKPDDHRKYTALAEKIKKAYNDKYLDRETGIYSKGLQTELSVPLFWNLVPEELKAKVAENLAKTVETNDFKLDVGIIGHKAILNALSENGYAETAYKIAAQETFPSWGWWIVNGATTLYENWNIDAEHDISLNHIMFGEIGAWLYKGIGGIKPDPKNPGFKNIFLRPNFFTALNNATVTHQTPYGELLTDWQRKGKSIIYSVTIPANSSAELYLPDGYDIRKATLKGTRTQIALQKGVSGAYTLLAGEWEMELRK